MDEVSASDTRRRSLSVGARAASLPRPRKTNLRRWSSQSTGRSALAKWISVKPRFRALERWLRLVGKRSDWPLVRERERMASVARLLFFGLPARQPGH